MADNTKPSIPFNPSIKQTLPPRVATSLHTLIDYLWDDEENDWFAFDPIDRKSHIFESLLAIQAWLETDELCTAPLDDIPEHYYG